MKDKVFIIDGSAFLYRAYYSLKPLHTKDGKTVQAVFGFCRMLKKLINKFDPKYMVVVWDSKGATERHELFNEYKATRQAAPSDLSDQKILIQEFNNIIKVKQLERYATEADDLIFSLSKDLNPHQVVVVSSDKDMAQMLSDRVQIFDPFKEEFIDPDKFFQKYGFSVDKIIFYYSLIGDSSDNIPGVKGIGPKSAQNIVNNFSSLEDLYNNLDKVENKRTKELLSANKENAFLSHKLFSMYYYNTSLSLQDCEFDQKNWNLAIDFFKDLNFQSLLKDIPEYNLNNIEQKSLFVSNNNYICVNTQELLEDLVNKLKLSKIFAIDTETDSLNTSQANCVGISICLEESTAYYIPMGHITIEQQLEKDLVVSKLKPILEDKNIKKIMHHAKFDQLVLSNLGMEVNGLEFDTLIAASLVAKDGSRINLKYLSEHYLNQSMLTFKETVTDKGYKNFSQVPISDAVLYASSDAHQTFMLKPILEKILEENNMQQKLFYDLEMPTNQVLYSMEKEGIIVDIDKLKELKIKVDARLVTLKQEILSLLPENLSDINLNSPKQLEDLLFNKLLLRPVKRTTAKTGYSTDYEVLVELAKVHPVPGLIIKYRELFKLKSTYIDAFFEYIDASSKIHCNFNQTGVATGRLSSSDPNMQNIPVGTVYSDINVRSIFKAPPGHLFISADYSQIELRILAYFSQDQNLLKAFESDQDIHTITASNLFDIGVDKVTRDQREMGKRINFSILYGLTAYGLSQDLNISFSDAQKYIEKYFAQFPGVSAWMDNVVEETKQRGYVTTYMGRRRYVPGIYEKNRTLFDAAKRVAINTKPQGTASEIMKMAMIKLHEHFNKSSNLNSHFNPDHSRPLVPRVFVDEVEKNVSRDGTRKIILQIHDELIISVPEDNIEQSMNEIKNILESVVSWNVPLKVTTRFGKDWGEVTK